MVSSVYVGMLGLALRQKFLALALALPPNAFDLSLNHFSMPRNDIK